MAAIDPQYVAARRVLLDALGALVAHRQAVVVFFYGPDSLATPQARPAAG